MLIFQRGASNTTSIREERRKSLRRAGARSQEKSNSMHFMMKVLLFMLASGSWLLAPAFT
jgi:hypothetical protein